MDAAAIYGEEASGGCCVSDEPAAGVGIGCTVESQRVGTIMIAVVEVDFSIEGDEISCRGSEYKMTRAIVGVRLGCSTRVVDSIDGIRAECSAIGA